MSTFRKKYRALAPGEQMLVDKIKDAAQTLEYLFDDVAGGGRSENHGLHRHVALAKTNLEQAVMWAVKGVTG